MVYNRRKAQEENKSKLAQKLSELIEEDSLRSDVLEALLEDGWKSKEVQLMETSASFSKGQEEALAEAEKKYQSEFEDLRSQLDELKTAPKQAQTQPEPQAQNGLPTAADKMFAGFQKQLEEMSGRLNKTVEENQTLRAQQERSRVNDVLREKISSAGLEDADDVIFFMRQKADFKYDPTDETVYVTKADDPSMPYDGPHTATTAEDFIKEFANSRTGSRFKPAPKDITESAGYSGNAREASNRQVQQGPSQEDYDAHDKRLGIYDYRGAA